MKSQSNSGKLRVCVVGAGRMGADHIERLTRRIVGAEVSAVVDADVSRAKRPSKGFPQPPRFPISHRLWTRGMSTQS